MLFLSNALETFLAEKSESEPGDIYWSYRNSLKGFQKFLEIDIPIEDIDSYDVACYLDNFFQEGMDLDMSVLELHCINDFMNWACERESLDKEFGILTLKELNSTHPFFFLLNYVLGKRQIVGNFMYWAIFLWATKKNEDAFSPGNLGKNRTYSFTALVDADSDEKQELLTMNNFCYYGGPLLGIVAITNQTAEVQELTCQQIIEFLRRLSGKTETVADIKRKIGKRGHTLPPHPRHAGREGAGESHAAGAQGPAAGKGEGPGGTEPGVAKPTKPARAGKTPATAETAKSDKAEKPDKTADAKTPPARKAHGKKPGGKTPPAGGPDGGKPEGG
ncbi:MAG: hypothetical protein LBF40_04285 [Deltaproteobacteria bacterium]|jgi:hypothetical protein|nr:hypothetical protein [Deltaproteobacteria bacterium]